MGECYRMREVQGWSLYLSWIVHALNRVFRSFSIWDAPVEMKLDESVVVIESTSTHCWVGGCQGYFGCKSNHINKLQKIPVSALKKSKLLTCVAVGKGKSGIRSKTLIWFEFKIFNVIILFSVSRVEVDGRLMSSSAGRVMTGPFCWTCSAEVGRRYWVRQ